MVLGALLDTSKFFGKKTILGVSIIFSRASFIQGNPTHSVYYQNAYDKNLILHKKESNLLLLQGYQELRNLLVSLSYFKTYIEPRDGLSSKGKYQAIGPLEAIDVAQQKELEQQTQLKQQNTKIWELAILNTCTAALVALTVLFALVLLKISRDKRKSNQRLKQKSIEITQHKDKIGRQEKLLWKINTDLEHAIIKLKKVQSQLVQSKKMASLGVLMAGVAHEINNPINFAHSGIHAIKKRIGLLESILAEKNNDGVQAEKLISEIKELVRSVENGTQRTARIVKDLGMFSHKGNNQHESVSVNTLLDKTLELFNESMSTINVVLNYGTVPNVEAPESDIGQVFMNIIQNAVQALDKEGTLTITTILGNNEDVQITFRDTGPGIPPNVLPNIFDPFFTTKPVGKGTGLGLSISYNLLEHLQGSISCHSEEGKGTTFVIRLPIKQRILESNG